MQAGHTAELAPAGMQLQDLFLSLSVVMPRAAQLVVAQPHAVHMTRWHNPERVGCFLASDCGAESLHRRYLALQQLHAVQGGNRSQQLRASNPIEAPHLSSTACSTERPQRPKHDLSTGRFHIACPRHALNCCYTVLGQGKERTHGIAMKYCAPGLSAQGDGRA